jgi:hypothetical protein
MQRIPIGLRNLVMCYFDSSSSSLLAYTTDSLQARCRLLMNYIYCSYEARFFACPFFDDYCLLVHPLLAQMDDVFICRPMII